MDTDGRAKVMKSALALFGERGYAATTLSDVRRAAGVSNGSLYHHFSSREALVYALRLNGIERYQAGFRRALRAGDAESVVRAGVRFHLRFAARNPVLGRILITPITPEVLSQADGALSDLSRRFFADVHHWYDACVSTGELEEIERALRYPLWLGPAQEVARAWLEQRGPLPTRHARALADGAWRALRTAGK